MLTPKESSQYFHEACSNVSVIPVLVINDVSIAKDLAKVLVDAGLPILEVTLRTPNALRVIEEMASVDGAIVGAGTVLNSQHVHSCKSAGSNFLVSPGFTETLIDTSLNEEVPLLPGSTTVAEIMHLAEKGFDFLKFFPAEANGGVPMLKNIYSPLPHIHFCPTGGVNLNNINEYLALPNVPVVGGTWLVKDDDIESRNWQGIAEKAKVLTSTIKTNR